MDGPTTKSLIRQNDDGSWEVNFGLDAPSTAWQHVELDEVLDLVLSDPKWEVQNHDFAKTPYLIDATYAQSLLGMPSGQATRKAQNAWIKDHGGSNVVKMTQPERETWIHAHLAQNNLWKYAIENKVGQKTN